MKKEKKESILQDTKECLICKDTRVLHKHHVFEGSGKRTLGDREGLVIWLCPYHHTISDKHCIHRNKKLELRIKKWAEQKWLEHTGKTKEDFIKIFNKNYL